MKHLLVYGLALIGAQLDATAAVASLHVHSGAGTPGILAQAHAPAAGAWVRFGALAPGFDPAEQGWNPSAVSAAWTEFGAAQVLAHRDGAGRFSATLTSESEAFAGKSVCLWIVQTLDGAEPSLDSSNVAAHALVTSSAKNWRFPSPDALAPANAVILSTSEVDQAWFGVRSASAITLDRSGMSYARWVGRTFDPTLPGVESTWMADPDGDGVVNLLEYVLGSSPAERKAAHTVSVAQTDARHYLEVEFDAAPWRADAKVVAEVSSDLVTWTAIESKVLHVHADGSERRVARDTEPVGEEAQRFIRLRAVEK